MCIRDRNRDAAEIRDIFSSSCAVLQGDTPLRDAHYWFSLLIRRVADLAAVYRCSYGNDIIWQYALIGDIGPRVRPAHDQASPSFLGKYGSGFFEEFLIIRSKLQREETKFRGRKSTVWALVPAPTVVRKPWSFATNDSRFRQRKQDRIIICDWCSYEFRFYSHSEPHPGGYPYRNWDEDVLLDEQRRGWEEGRYDCTWVCINCWTSHIGGDLGTTRKDLRLDVIRERRGKRPAIGDAWKRNKQARWWKQSGR